MRKLEWDDMGVKVDGRQLHHLRFADDIVLITPNMSQAERMLIEFDETCGCIGFQGTTGRPPTRWSDFFTKSFKENYDALRVPCEGRNYWATLARDRDNDITGARSTISKTNENQGDQGDCSTTIKFAGISKHPTTTPL
ncbi:hypothetical protein RB195_018720 [Necator americanus]|uniref:Reverse transcriptase domain-containing protein n=1 Tax=Necator americanus TaxID=51031 RepID=A0ABR1CCA1_NECAM